MFGLLKDMIRAFRIARLETGLHEGITIHGGSASGSDHEKG
jgi:hypothetical protein